MRESHAAHCRNAKGSDLGNVPYCFVENSLGKHAFRVCDRSGRGAAGA